MTTREKFLDLCYVISKDNGHYDLWWEYIKIYEKDDDCELLKNKINNFIKRLNENDTDFLNMDVEKEIYDFV